MLSWEKDECDDEHLPMRNRLFCFVGDFGEEGVSGVFLVGEVLHQSAFHDRVRGEGREVTPEHLRHQTFHRGQFLNPILAS